MVPQFYLPDRSQSYYKCSIREHDCVFFFKGGETEVFSNPLPPQNFEDFGEDDEGYDNVI